LALGVFRKECWCLSYPSLCSQSDYVAAQALAHPEVYNTLTAPPVVSSPEGAAVTTPPASGEDAGATIDQLLSDQMTAWQAQNQASMDQTQSNLDALAAQYRQLTVGGTNWWLIGLGIAGGLILLWVVK
jgi:hypothetical protein